MPGENIDQMGLDFMEIAYATFPRELVFQRQPNASETTTDDAGYPITTYTDLDASNPIPCLFLIKNGRQLIIKGQQKTVTLYEITVPGSYKSNGITMAVPFSLKYRAHILPKDTAGEVFLQVFSGGPDDPKPGIVFIAVALDELV